MMTNSFDYVGGIMSTVYFSLPPKNIDKVIFLGSEKLKNENDAKSQTLSKLMLMLNVITPEQIFLKKCQTQSTFESFSIVSKYNNIKVHNEQHSQP